MGITERKQRQREEVRLSILNAARQMLIDDGWLSLSIRKIADVIEYSIPVIYDHFENKEAIQLVLTKEGYCILGQKVKEAQAKTSNVAEQIEKMAFAYWDFAFTHKQYYQMMYGLGMPTCENARTVEEIKFFGDLVRQSIAALIAQSSKKDIDVNLKFYVFLSMLHGLISINMDKQEEGQLKMAILVLRDSIHSFVKSILY